MTQFVVDLLDSSNNPIGSGPLQNVVSVSVASKLDEAGEIIFSVPATDTKAVALISTAYRVRVRLSSGALHYGIIDRDFIDVTADQPTRTVRCFDILRELAHYTMGWWCFYNQQDMNTVVLPDLVADTPWSTGVIDAALGNLYYRFDGDSRLAALYKIAQVTGKHFRLGTTLRTFDFGAFGVASSIRLINVDHALKAQDTTTDIAIIGSLKIINDRSPVINRIIPWGAGQDGGDTNRAKVSLFHLTPGDSRWANIKVKPGVRGAQTTISAVGEAFGVPNARYTVADSTGFLESPITQVFWCYDPDDLTLGFGYNMVIRDVESPTSIVVRGSPTIPSPPTSFPAYIISNPQLYIEDATAYAAEPRESVKVFTDVTLTDTSSTQFEYAASELYNRAWNYLQTHKTPQTTYAISVFNCPDSLKPGDTVQVIYRGAVTRDGVVVKWVDVNDTFNVVNITRTFEANGSTLATIEVSDLLRQPTGSSTALSDAGEQVDSHNVTVGTVSASSAGGGGGGSGGAGDPLTFQLPLVRTINDVTLPMTAPAANVRNVLGIDNGETAASTKTALDATNPTSVAAGGAASPGTSLLFSHRDHTHGAPGTWPATAHNVLDSTYHSDVLTGTITRGDLLVGNATPKIARLPLGGSAKSFLTRDANDVVWSGGLIDIASGKTLSVTGTLTLTPSSDGITATIPATGTVALIDHANAGMVRQSDTWHAYGGFQLSTTTIACTLNTWAWITNAGHTLWVAVESSGVTVSGDVFTAVHTGDYTGQVTISITGTNGRDFFIRVFNITTNAQMGYTIGATTTGTPNFTPITLPLYMELTAGDTFRFEIKNITDNADPDVRSAVYNIVYVHD